jgi:hypothetical protein
VFLSQNPEIMDEIEKKVKEMLAIDIDKKKN